MVKHVWGVDSATNVTSDLFDCVMKNFGYPNFWGRYLTTVPNAAEGLTKQEIAFLRSKGTKILPIYSIQRQKIRVSKRDSTLCEHRKVLCGR